MLKVAAQSRRCLGIISSLKTSRFFSDQLSSIRRSFSTTGSICNRANYQHFSILDHPEYLKIATTENSLQNLDKKEINENRNLVKAALLGYGENLKFCNSVQRNDRELVMLAVQNNRYESALEFASEDLKDDFEIVEESMKNGKSSFRFASERIRDDKGMSLKAISYLPSNILYLSERLQKDSDIIERAVELDGELIVSLNFRREEMMEKKEILLKILETCSAFCKMHILTELLKKKSVLLEDQQILQRFISLHQKEIRNSTISQTKVNPGEKIIEMIVRNCNLLIDRQLIVKELILFKYASAEIRSDRDFVLSIIAQKGELLEFCDEKLRDDFTVVLNAVCGGNSLRFASERLRNDQRICKAAVKYYSNQFQYASDNLKSNREFILMLIVEYPQIFEFVNESLKSDLNFVKKAFEISNRITKFITHCDEELFQLMLNDRLIYDIDSSSLPIQQYRNQVLDYLTTNPYAFAKFFPNDKEMALKCISIGFQSITQLSPELQQDPELAQQMLKHASVTDLIYYSRFNKNLLPEKKLIMEKIKEEPWLLLSCLPDEYQQDREIVEQAVNSGMGSSTITKTFRNDREFALESLKGRYFCLGDVSPNLRSDLEIVTKAVEKDFSNIFYANPIFKSDRKFVKQCIEKAKPHVWDITMMEQLPESLADDYEIAELVLKVGGCTNFQYLSERLRNDKSLAVPAILERPYLLQHCPLLYRNKEFILELIEKSSADDFYLYYLPEELKEDFDILLAFFTKWPMKAARYCEDTMYTEWTQHKELVKIVIPHYPQAYHRASSEIQKDEEIFNLFSACSFRNALVPLNKP